MALKPVFPRKPLVDRPFTSLPARQILLKGELHDKMLLTARALSGLEMTPYLLGALAPAAYLLKDRPLIARCETALNQSDPLDQKDVLDALALSRALLARYEHTGDKAPLETLMRLMKRLQEKTDAALLLNAGEALEILIRLYDLTGKKPLLALMSQLREQALDYTSALHTFCVVKPAEKQFDLSAMQTGLEIEQGDVGGYYTRQHALINGLSLARNLKTPALFACVSGSAKEKEAPMAGYTRIMRWHGLPGGVFTADPYLSGQNEKHGADMRVCGEFAHSLAMIALLDEAAYPALESAALNALLPAINEKGVQKTYDVDGRAPRVPVSDAPEHAAAVLKGLTAFSQSLFSIGKQDELQVNLFMDGAVKTLFKGEKVTVQARLEHEALHLSLDPQKPCEGTLILRVPDWAEESYAEIGEGHVSPEDGFLRVHCVLEGAEAFTVRFFEKQESRKGYRDSSHIFHGPRLQRVKA